MLAAQYCDLCRIDPVQDKGLQDVNQVCRLPSGNHMPQLALSQRCLSLCPQVLYHAARHGIDKLALCFDGLLQWCRSRRSLCRPW